ncbi:hypothetical protein AURDEDRAFT_165367 [Auricularia subglabra TFB-10046 SS5]|nr:hypothetical protein AURDEDRAFT_165367 [Auricularia subglabra TFB-10046 SS5]
MSVSYYEHVVVSPDSTGTILLRMALTLGSPAGAPSARSDRLPNATRRGDVREPAAREVGRVAVNQSPMRRNIRPTANIAARTVKRAFIKLMNAANLLTPASASAKTGTRPSRVRHPSQAFRDCVVQSAANEAELNVKLGRKATSTGKENRATTVQERREQSRSQILIESVVPRKAAGTPKPRAPGGLAGLVRQTTQATQVPKLPQMTTEHRPLAAMPPSSDTTGAHAADSTRAQALDATVGQKRPGSPSLELAQPPTRRRRGTGECKPRACGGDLPTPEQLFVERCYGAVRLLESINPFTSKTVNNTKINNAIVYSRRAEPDDKDLVVTEAMRQLIGNRFHQLHGDIKLAAQKIFAAHYGLLSSRNRATVKKNKTIATRLLTGDGFVYKNTKERLGMFQHPCISDCINAVWFSGRDKEGPRFAKIFNADNEGIKLETIALVLTAIFNCTKEWATGIRGPIQFRETTFRGDYADLLQKLRDYAKANPALVVKLRRKLYKAGMAHAGVVIDTTTRSGLTKEDIERAVAMDTISDDSGDEMDLNDADDDDNDDDATMGVKTGHSGAEDPAAALEPAAEEQQAEDPTPEDDEDAGPRRAKGKTKAAVPDADEDPESGAHEDLGKINELEQQVYEGLSPDDQRVFLELTYEERDVCVEMTPEDREIFLAMSPEERAEWMNDVDADGDDGADVGAQSSFRANKSITFDDGDQTTTGSELD